MKSIIRWSCVLAVMLVLVTTLPLLAQNSGSITGTVVDPAGAVISDASVQAVDQGKGTVVFEIKTDADGLFRLGPLQPGTYSIHVRANGMKELRTKGLVLDSSQVLGVGELKLSVGSTSETLTVEATTPLVEIATADHSAVIDSKQVSETLLNGRDFQSLVKTLPGVVSNDMSDFRLAFNNTDAFHVNGLRGSANNVFLDGAVNTDVGANDGQFTQMSMDAVGEFKLQTSNFAAEYGRNPGVVISINTKSGGKQYHGTLYEFNRQDAFGATPPTPLGSTQATKGFLRFNQYGGNLGGPIPFPKAKDRLFFFFNYEGTRGLRPGNAQFANRGGQGYTLPNPNVFTGDFSSQYTGGNMCVNTGTDAATGITINHTADCGATQGNNGFLNGQIFQPGTIKYNSAGQVLTGTPFANNRVPVSMFSNQAPAWIKYWQQAPNFANAVPDTASPSGAGTPGAGQFRRVFIPFNETYTLFKHQEVIRLDYNINAKTNFFFRWVDDSQTENFHNLFDFGDYPILPEFRKKPGSSWSWNLVNVITPTLTNEFIFSYNHLTQVVDIAPGTPKAAFDRNTLGFTFSEMFPNSNLDNRAPVMVRNPNTQDTFAGGTFHPGWHSEARMFTWTDNVTKVSGPHTFKTGVFFEYNQAGQQPVWQDTTFLDFSTGSANSHDTNSVIANTLLGWYANAQQSNGVFFGAFRFHQVEVFGQDSWKVNRKLTVDYGLRWGYLGPNYTVQPFFQNYFDPARYNPANAVTLNNHQGNFFGAICSAALIVADPLSTCPASGPFGDPFNGLVQENRGIPPGFLKHHYANFAPRVGFSWDPTGSGKMAIRGGGGIFYERIRQNVNSFDALGNPPLSYTPTVFNGNIDNIGPNLVTGIRTPVDLIASDREGQIPTTYGYSLGIQREMPGHIGLEAAFVGNQARHLQYQFNAQALPLGSVLDTQGKPPAFFARFPGYRNINFTKYGANSSYNALQVKAIRRFHRDLTLTADYTYSKTIDLSDCDSIVSGSGSCSGTQMTDPLHPGLDYSRAGYDRRHVFNFNYVYVLPEFRGRGALSHVLGGWEVSGITRFWTGNPIDVLTGTGNPGNFVGVARPDLANAPVYLNRDDHLHWLNPAAFIGPGDGTVGNVKRYAFNGPGINNWDISLFKNFNFNENMRLQLRLETFNTFNHTQPAAVGNNNVVTFNPSGVGLPENNPNQSAGAISGYRDPRNVQLGAKFYF